MRLTPPAVAIALTLATVSSVGHTQRPDTDLDARSVLLADQARAQIAGGRLDVATDYLESALALDSRNRAAYQMLAQVAVKQNLPGKAIRLYRESLAIEPNDVAALAGQGEAMVAKGAVTKARENLVKIRALCVRGCDEVTQLTAAIDRGPPPAVQSAQAAPVAPAKPEGSN